MSQAYIAPQPIARQAPSPKMGMWVFLASEVMFFTALIGAFLTMKRLSPAGANQILNIPVTAVNTFVLIMSSTSVVFALSAIQDGKVRTMRNWLLVTLLLGGTFLGIQITEYGALLREGLSPSSSPFGSGFYGLTGFHGFHVLVGLLWLIGLIVLTLRGRLTPDHAMWVEIFGLYWHFVDVVWIILFTIVYLI